MRILGIRVNGFGRFAHTDFGPFQGPVTLFLGPNEAGKSTLLEFIRRVLFGFRTARGRAPSGYNDYPPLAGGRHGGSVTIVSDAGETVTVQRFQGMGAGPVTLTDASGGPLPEGDLPRLLGRHSRDVFKNVFTFTLDELHDEALLRDDSVNAQIYSVGMGATKLPAARNALGSAKQALFLKGGSKHKIAGAGGELGRIDSQLAEVANNAAEYSRLTSRLKEVEAELERLSGQQREHRSKLDHQQRLNNAWDDWNDLNDAERELSQLPLIKEFPADGISRLRELEERVRTAKQECDAAERLMTEARSTAEVHIDHEAILSYSADVQRLVRGRDSFDKSVRDLPKRTAELVDHKNSLDVTLKDLGPDWDETRLENFDLSLTVREEISQYQHLLQEAGEMLKRCKADLDRDESALKEADDAKNEAEREIGASVKPHLDSNQIRQQRDLIRRAKSRLDKIDRANQHVNDLQSHLDSLKGAVPPAGGPGGSRIVAAISLVVGITLLLAGALLGGPVLPVGIVAGTALVGIAAYLFALGPSSAGAVAESPLARPIRESLCKAETELKDLQSALKEDAASLALETIDEHSLIAAEGSLDEEQARVDRWKSVSEALDAAKGLTAQRKRRTEKSRNDVRDAEAQLDSVRLEWRQWLRARQLRDTFVPETVVELRSKVDLGLTQLRNVRSWRQRIDAIQEDIEEYVQAVEPLATTFNIVFDKSKSGTVEAAAVSLEEMHADVERRVRDRTGAKDDLKKAERQLRERERDRHEAEKEMNDLLRSGDATEVEEFRKREETYRQRTDLEKKRRDALAHLQRRSGPGEPLESLKKQLGDTDIQTIRDQASSIQEQIDSAAASLEELSTARGSIQKDLENLTGEEDSSKLRADRHRLLEEIRGHAREWAVHTIAENLLKEAQAKFEKERQPGVVRHAESFFKGITGGRYRTVFSPLGSSEIQVTDSLGVSKQPVQLSQGTRGQLFLSLRFGLIRELGQRSEPLPVILDEALVNFDPERGLRAARAFVELSQTNQVLVFTCHPTIVELFRKAAATRGVQEPDVVLLG